jgi:putative nucleotidyltransferase with HDIG domain
MRGLRNAVTQAVVFRQFEHLKKTGFDLDELWRHSVLTAQTCAMLARQSRVKDLTPDELYTCGLLHDIGKVVMLDTVGTEYMAVVRTAERQQIPMVQAERLQLGYDHTDIGAIIATCWSLPIPVAAAIEFHHGPQDAVEGSAVVALVAAANRIVHRVIEGDTAAAIREIDAPTAAFLGLAPADVAEVVAYLADQHTLVEV